MSVAVNTSIEQTDDRLRLQKLAPAVVSALLALALYAITLGGTFIYDDVSIVLQDPRMASPGLWKYFWTQPYVPTVDKVYRPLLSLSFAVQHLLHGERAWPYHLVNILLHAGVSAGVAELGRRIAGWRVGLIAGALFAIHPVHVEAVAAIYGRSELASGLAMVIGLCVFIARPLDGRRVAIILACLLVALFTKETGMVFPGLILALLPLKRERGLAPEEKKPALWLCAGLVYLLAAYVVFRELMIGFSWDRAFLEWVLNPMVRSHGLDRVLMPVVLVGRYLVLLVAPHRLSLDYGGTAIGWTAGLTDPYLYLGALAIGGWVALACCAVLRRRWAVFFCLVGLGLTYGMVGNIVALIGPIFAERIMYLPSAFFLMLGAMLLAKAPARVGAPVVVLLVLVGGTYAFSYVRLWNDPMALYQRCLADQPGSERAYHLVYREYAYRGDWVSARRIGGESIAAARDSEMPYVMCIEADLALGRIDDARWMWEEGMSACHGFERLALVPYGREIDAAATTRPPTEFQSPHQLHDPDRPAESRRNHKAATHPATRRRRRNAQLV